MARFALAGFFFAFVVHPQLWSRATAGFLFVVAGLTDWLDGWIARRTKTETHFGALADPLADKLLVVAALIAFLDVKELGIPGWVIFLTIARELMIGSLRALAALRGRVLAADRWGKWKMGVQTGCITVILAILVVRTFLLSSPSFVTSAESDRLLTAIQYWPRNLSYLIVAATWASGMMYLRKNKRLLQDSWGK
jgi:CDP-diacylglycerol--glycerol-3-phosphate 3-phosphatidyltransferase